MAERGAHLTGTTLIKPSLFEIIAQESLSATLEPATKKLFSFLVTCNPERYGHLLRWTDEAYLIFNAVLQKYYFNKYSASFSESFYSLKRVPVAESTNARRMTGKQQRLSLILTVLFPYMKSKVVEFSKRCGHQPTETTKQMTWEKQCRLYAAQSCTTACTLYEILVLYSYILYLSGKSVYPTPLLSLIPVTLTYADDQPSSSISDILQKMKKNQFGINDGMDVLQRVVTLSIEFGAFFLQFLAWWSRPENYSGLMTLPTPLPPKVSDIGVLYKGMCPICNRPQRIKTVLSVSGYAFCYQCILLAVRNSGKCPVTKYPAKEDDLIRVYI